MSDSVRKAAQTRSRDRVNLLSGRHQKLGQSQAGVVPYPPILRALAGWPRNVQCSSEATL